MRTPDRSTIELQLHRILASPRFVASDRLSAFLRFVVQAALQGDPGGAKEVVIAGEVYGRGVAYDPQVDSTVRADASRLRARLREFYSAAGANDQVLIEIPKGTYLPTFSFRTPPLAVEPEPEPVQRPTIWLIATLAVLVVGALSAWALASRQARNNARAAAELEARARHLVPAVGDHLLRAAEPEPEYHLDTLLLAAGSYEAAVQLDQSRTSAWAGMAQTYHLAAQFDHRYASRAHEAAYRAVTLDPNHAEAQYLNAYIKFFEDWDFQGAGQGFHQTIQLEPRWEVAYRHYSDAATLAGQTDKANAVVESGLRIFPHSTLMLLAKAMLRYHERRYDEMLAVAAQLSPDLGLTHWVGGLAREQKGEFDEAERELRLCLTISPRLTRCAIALVHLQARRGRAVESEKGAAALSNGESELTIARVYQYAGLRNKAQTIEWIRRGIAQHDYSIPWVLIDPRFDHLRKDPEFLSEVRRITSKP